MTTSPLRLCEPTLYCSNLTSMTLWQCSIEVGPCDIYQDRQPHQDPAQRPSSVGQRTHRHVSLGRGKAWTYLPSSDAEFSDPRCVFLQSSAPRSSLGNFGQAGATDANWLTRPVLVQLTSSSIFSSRSDQEHRGVQVSRARQHLGGLALVVDPEPLRTLKCAKKSSIQRRAR